MILPSRSFAFFKPNMSQLVPEPAMFGYKIVLIINFILLSVDPVRNLSSLNKVIGMNPNDFFETDTHVRIQVLSAAQPEEWAYGDFYYIPKGWSIDEGSWHFFNQKAKLDIIPVAVAEDDDTRVNAEFTTGTLQPGEHTFHAGFTTMRFNGSKWVDSGNDYVLDIPFITGVTIPETGYSENAYVWIGVLLVSVLIATKILKSTVRL